MNPAHENQYTVTTGRRKFLYTAGLFGLALHFPLPSYPEILKGERMGIVVHSYGLRWNSKANSPVYPPFTNAMQLLEHCHSINAGGIQVGVNGWTREFATEIRQKSETLGLFLEGSIGLPKSESDLENFENQVIQAKAAGISILRTVCLGGRRYETFNSAEEFEAFRNSSIQSLQWAKEIVKKHKMKLAVENHKDWRAEEMVELIKLMDSEWVGVTLDFGNNISLLEDPTYVIRTLAPYAFSTHIKDMGVKANDNGFLLSEVPLGKGVVDLGQAVEILRKYNPGIKFNLEMITRDPLEIPYLKEKYWATFQDLPAKDLANIINIVKEKSYPGSLPTISNLSNEAQLALEEEHILQCLEYSRNNLKLI
ncbi:sugar phosphate isomerase/epimerase family protein [Shivajiella indica]|uniref:Sugar phosphate isomerase/epimerase family protein n=1 Tax=Shivajiella indica TaxID=872115 RepID=A0ABW5B1Z7_9BACT